MIIDTHCHIDLYPNPEKILQECVKANLTVISVTNLPSHFEMGYPHFKSQKRIRIALGMHPLFANLHEKEFKLFLKNISKTSYIGEIGLDFSKEGYSTKEIQIKTFTRILENIADQKKILSIHSRRAEKEVIELLDRYKIKSAIFHWYSGPLYLIDKITELGYYFSVNIAMTKSENGRKIIQKIPMNKILTETDGPFTKNNDVISKPIDVKNLHQYLSNVWAISSYEVEKVIERNFSNLVSNIR
ncbi:Qat anti-phage system TatD family nuclease QatD [Chryseobacterium scophthalmum]|uniref:Qat anti-phage system TatD family nuclease QatD n=1 Tax=Chryseobacterium scophthalmum TaxID=59733 RepID=UPI00398AB8EE